MTASTGCQIHPSFTRTSPVRGTSLSWLLSEKQAEFSAGVLTYPIVLCAVHIFFFTVFYEIVCEIKLKKKSIVRRILWPKGAKHLLSECLEQDQVATGRVFSWDSFMEILVWRIAEEMQCWEVHLSCSPLLKSASTHGCSSEKKRWAWCFAAFSFALGMGLSTGKDIAYH